MKKKKSSLALILICVLFILAAFAACGGSGGSPKTPAMEVYNTSASVAEAPYPAPEADYNGFNANADSASMAQEAEVASPSELSADSKMIFRVYMDIETMDYDSSVEGIGRLCGEMGGYVEYSNVSGIRYGSASLRRSDFTLRIPSDRLDEFESSCGGIGNVYSSQREVENATATYVDMSARLTAYETEQARLLELLEQAQNLDDIISLNSRLSEVRYSIDSIKSSLRNIDAQVSYSTVYISLNEVSETTTMYGVPKTFGEKVSTAFSKGFESFKRFMSGMGVFLLGELPFTLLMILAVLIPIALVVLVVLLIVRSVKKKLGKNRGTKETDRRLNKIAHKNSENQNDE